MTPVDDVSSFPVWEVINVHDGDTIRVRRGGEVRRVRFACIDAPELAQPLGPESRDYLRQLIASAGNKVRLNVTNVDRYGRDVAEVWITRRDIPGPELVQSLEAYQGMVYGYERYKASCPNWAAIQSTEAQAIEAHRGVWAANYEKPWDYRHSKH